MGNRITPSESAQIILEANRRGEQIVCVLATSGAAAGARMLVYDDGRTAGTLGSPELEVAAHDVAQRVFTSRQSELSNNLFAELHAPLARLFIFGAGHIAVPLADLAVKLEFDVTILDDRDEFASAARFPAEANVRRLDLAAPLDGVRVDGTTYIVLVTRAHKHDFDLLRALLALEQQPRYIGMIGSRRRIRAAFTALLEGGVARDQLRALHAPIGLDIGAETPAEIAVSIAAELIRIRRGGSAESIASEENVLERFFAEPSS
ncbi:MAG: XdhC family protein [Gemmatimonadota bacterium]